jgi:hypothetical protein
MKGGLFDSVNQGLDSIYAKEGHTELHSFRQWKQKGFQVMRGEKALLFWGQTLKGKEKLQPGTEEKDFEFWPLAYLFSQKQVQPIQ